MTRSSTDLLKILPSEQANTIATVALLRELMMLHTSEIKCQEGCIDREIHPLILAFLLHKICLSSLFTAGPRALGKCTGHRCFTDETNTIPKTLGPFYKCN